MSNGNTSPRPRRKWLWILGGIIVVIVAIALIVPLFINTDTLRAEIASSIEAQTGRKATVGPIHVRILPSAAAVVDGVQIGNPAGFPAGNLLSVDSFRGGLALGDLLHGNIHITSIELVNPKVTMIEDETGHDNYTFTTPAAPPSSKPASSSSSFSLSAIDDVTLSDASVSLAVIPRRGAQPFNMAALDHLTLHFSHVVPDIAHIKEWEGDANLKGLTVALGALKGQVNFSSGSMKLSGGAVNVTFDAQAGKVTALKGKLDVADLNKPVAKFDISTPSFDADALLASLQQTPQIPASPKSSASAASNALVAQGHVSAQQIVWSPYTGGNASADIRIFGDHTEVWPASMTLYGGSLQISARTDAKQTPTRFSANVKLQQLDIARLLAQGPAGLRGKMAGLAQIDLELAGASSANWAKDLSGHGNFAIRDGKLPGVNLAGSLGVLAKAAGVNETPFRSITGDLVIGGGLVTTKTTHMDSPDGTVDLAGSYSLVNDSLDYTGKAVVTPGGAGVAGQVLTGVLGAALKTNVSTMTVPFTIKGTTANPQFRPGVPTTGAPGQQQKPATATDALASGLQKLFKKH